MIYTLQPNDIPTLHTALDLAKKAGEQAAKLCAKAYLTVGESEGLELAGYADEAKMHLGTCQLGEVSLQEGHARACKTGLQLLFDRVKKTREREKEDGIDTSASEDRMEQLRRVAVRMRLNVQLEVDEHEPAMAGV